MNDAFWTVAKKHKPTWILGISSGSNGANPIAGSPLGMALNSSWTEWVEQFTKSGSFL